MLERVLTSPSLFPALYSQLDRAPMLAVAINLYVLSHSLDIRPKTNDLPLYNI